MSDLIYLTIKADLTVRSLMRYRCTSLAKARIKQQDLTHNDFYISASIDDIYNLVKNDESD